MIKLAEIDPNMHPEGAWCGSASYHSNDWASERPGSIYKQLLRGVQRPVDVILIAPWLKMGGADLGLLHFANALAGPLRKRVLVITTEPVDSTWRRRLNAEVQFLDAGHELATLEPDVGQINQVAVLLRLLLQLQAPTVHVMNSALAWEVVRRHGLAIKQVSRLYASLYCDDFDHFGLPVGYAQSFLPQCFGHLHAVHTDNTVNYKQWVARLGLPENLFRVIKFPAPEPIQKARDLATPAQDVCHDVLWAGRLDRQKRVDLLAAVAEVSPDLMFHVYGHSVIRDLPEIVERRLRDLPNVVMHEAFSTFSEVLVRDYAAFLYTSAWDGMPNILLEAAAANLPILAQNVGGIPDFIQDEQLFAAHADPGEIARLLRILATDAELRCAIVSKQREMLADQRTFRDFVKQIELLPGYLEPQFGERHLNSV